MKNLVIFLLFLVIFLGCKKDNTIEPISAKEEFNSLPPAYLADVSTNQFLNYFTKNDSLFFQGQKTDQAIYLDLLAGPSVRIPWAKGLKDIFCIGAYGGSAFPGGINVYIYFKNSKKNLFSPAEDSLNFGDIKINGQDVIVELFSVWSFLENMDSLSHLIRPEKVRKYYGRYNVITQKLSMD